MMELLKALTRLANVAADYLEGNVKTEVVEAAPEAIPAMEPTVPKRTRRTKAEILAAAPVPMSPELATPADDLMNGALSTEAAPKTALSESESVTAVNEIATVYIRRFKVQADGIAAVRKLMNGEYKVSRLTDLNHAQRIQFIQRLKSEIAAADSVSAGV